MNKNDKSKWDVNFEFIRSIHDANMNDLEKDLEDPYLNAIERGAYEELMTYFKQVQICIDGYEKYLNTK